MTASQLGALLGLSREGVSQLVKSDSTFPAPSQVLSSGPLWERRVVVRWARETGRMK
jgi:hypothetical protein